MRRFYCEELGKTGEFVKPDKGECRHMLQTLRMKVGDELVLMDGKGKIAEAIVAEVQGRNGMICEVRKIVEMPRPNLELHLFVAPPCS